MLVIRNNDTVLQKQLKKRLNARRWTYNDLAEAAKMPKTTVRDIVLRGREPYAYNLRKIADCFVLPPIFGPTNGLVPYAATD